MKKKGSPIVRRRKLTPGFRRDEELFGLIPSVVKRNIRAQKMGNTLMNKRVRKSYVLIKVDGKLIFYFKMVNQFTRYSTRKSTLSFRCTMKKINNFFFIAKRIFLIMLLHQTFSQKKKARASINFVIPVSR
jgi:large-conductance mechanosensitive channel